MVVTFNSLEKSISADLFTEDENTSIIVVQSLTPVVVFGPDATNLSTIPQDLRGIE